MNTERETQNRVIALFCDELGYRFLGDRSDFTNSNIQEDLLTAYLVGAGYAPEKISRALYLLRKEADNPSRSLYDNNKAVYDLLRYGAIKTEEKYFLKWKEDEADNSRFKLDKYLLKMCRKDRLIELMHDFVIFDGGIKKLPRVHQYFGVKASQAHVKACKGGIIWHTQGSGKSIVMVLLAKWILENKSNARVLILTDRDELDKQIERVFADSGETIYRTSSGHDLMAQLGQAKPRLLCSLVHKFGKKGVDDFDAFIEELKRQPCPAVGRAGIG